MDNNELIQSLLSYKKMLDLSYHFVIGRKNQRVDIVLNFDKKRFFHLAGLQYCVDLPELKKDREKVFNQIENSEDFQNVILNDPNYAQICDRIKFLSNIEGFLDSNEMVFRLNKQTGAYSLIKADYVLKQSDATNNMYLFISKESKDSDTFFCQSAFSRNKSEKDYTVGHMLPDAQNTKK